MKLSVNIGSVQFKNPVTVASGTFSYIQKYSSIADLKKLGAIIPKTVTLNPREGNPSPRIVETPSGMVNAIGIENAGADCFINGKLKELKKIGAPIIASVSAHTDKDFLVLTEKFNKAGVSALELNLSCPNLKHKTLVAQDKNATYCIVKAVVRKACMPIVAKLTPNVTDISLIAQAAQDAGASAVSLVNTFSAMVIDVNKRRSKLGNVTGGLRGPAIRPIALYMVYQTAQRIKIPIIAMGGITNSSDALEFIMAGATMVAVGTASFVNPQAPRDVLEGIKKYMQKNKIKDIKELIGVMK